MNVIRAAAVALATVLVTHCSLTVTPQPVGALCRSDRDCASGSCQEWFADKDLDSHGDPKEAARLCSPSPKESVIVTQASGQRMAVLKTSTGQFSSASDDCCDVLLEGSGSIFPGQTNFFTSPQTACPQRAPFDYDCSGAEDAALANAGECDSKCSIEVWVAPVPACGKQGLLQQCAAQGLDCVKQAPRTTLRACR